MLFNNQTPYPGMAAILPTVGALLLILCQQNESSIVNRILSCRCLTYTGDISYALYLVHWPVIVFATAFFPAGLSPITKMTIVCLSLFAASILTLQIENPIRQKRLLSSRKQLFSFAACSVVIIALVSFLTVLLTPKPVDVISAIVSESVLKTIEPNNYGYIEPSEVATVGARRNANTVVWGDSHAMNLFDGLVANSGKSGLSFKFLMKFATPPVLGLDSLDYGAGISTRDEMYPGKVLQYINNHREVTNVILVANWTAYLEGNKYFGHTSGDTPTFTYLGKPVRKESAYKIFERQLGLTVSALCASNRNVFICLPIPTYDVNVSKAVHLLQLTGRDPNATLGCSLKEYESVNTNIMTVFSNISRTEPHVTIIPLQFYLSTNGTTMVAVGTNSLYKDSQHLSSYGSLFIGQQVSKIVSGR